MPARSQLSLPSLLEPAGIRDRTQRRSQGVFGLSAKPLRHGEENLRGRSGVRAEVEGEFLLLHRAVERDGFLQILACDRQIAAKEQETAVQPVGEAQIPVVLVARRKPTQSADGLGRGLDVAADQAADKDSVERRITLPRVADLLDQLLSARERGRRLPSSITARGDQGLAERQLQLQL